MRHERPLPRQGARGKEGTRQMTFYVFDLDGTLADHSHRVPLIVKGPDGGVKDWTAFTKACVDDKPILPMIRLFQAIDFYHSNRVEIWTGRSGEVRGETEQWLIKQGLWSGHLTFMRPEGDHRDDVVLKREYLERSAWRPDVVFEDRRRVVDMWRAEGITCLQNVPGDF